MQVFAKEVYESGGAPCALLHTMMQCKGGAVLCTKVCHDSTCWFFASSGALCRERRSKNCTSARLLYESMVYLYSEIRDRTCTSPLHFAVNCQQPAQMFEQLMFRLLDTTYQVCAHVFIMDHFYYIVHGCISKHTMRFEFGLCLFLGSEYILHLLQSLLVS